MGKTLDIFTALHKKTSRDYIGRMLDEKVACMKVAKRYDQEYWDGDRKYGYGGFRYDGRWEAVARRLIDIYRLPADARILDAGCGKGFLLYEFSKLLPGAQVKGFDISEYAVVNAKPEVKDRIFVHDAKEPFPFKDKEFDLVLSLNVVHNLLISGVKSMLQEMERVGKNRYLVTEAYRNEQELFNLQCWVLTGECFFTPQEWVWLFEEFGYSGDYEFIYFES